jgi:hypothetical protein
MSRKRFGRVRPEQLTYANVMATAAVFLALGGGAYAAFKLPNHSVGSKQLKSGAVTPPKIAQSAITLFKGQKGDKGDKGDQGPVGPSQGFAAAQASGAVPSSTPDSGGLMQTTVTTSASGRLFVLARGTINVKCTTGDGTFVQLGVYVDGAAVPATGRVIAASSVGTEISVWGLSATVSPGSHLVELASDCQPGDTTSAGVTGDAALGAILVGS